ncbi:MAG TPA: CARDB domain-containing protein, partial [Tepidisphaeraceae bacterium]|nr:CARDB domain-containing protein [Tepidisphaeraceae bacterium]
SDNSQQRARTASEQDQRRAVENAMYFPSGKRDGSQLMVQQIGPREVRVGQEYNYQLRVTNLTNAPLTGVMLHERVPQDLKLASDQGRENDGQVRINVGDLGPGESKVIQMSGTPSNPGTIDTCVSAQFNPPTLCTHVAVVAPQIRITAEGPSQADVCQDLMYRYTVTNTGTGTAHNVVLQENLPDGVQTTDGQRNFSINVGDLGQGQSKTVTARLRAKQPGQFTTRAIAQSDAGKAESEQVATNVLAPRLQVTVSGPRDAFMGEPLAYQVTVKNVGDAAAADTRVRLGATPGHVEFVNAEGAQGAQLASEREGTGQNLGNIAPGEARTVTVNFKSIQGGPMSVEATAQARCAQDVSTSVNTNLKTITASTLIVTHDPDPVPVGQNVTYQITVENKGTAPDHNVRVTAQIPDGEQFVSANGQTSATNSGQTVTFGPIDTLQPKQSTHWTVVAKAMQPQEVQFKTTLASEATPQTSVKLEPTKMFGIERGTETRTNTAQPQQQPNQEQKQTPPQNNDFNK